MHSLNLFVCLCIGVGASVLASEGIHFIDLADPGYPVNEKRYFDPKKLISGTGHSLGTYQLIVEDLKLRVYTFWKTTEPNIVKHHFRRIVFELLKPCKRTDLECLRASSRQFFENTARGRSEYNMTAIDPLIISSYDEVLGYDTEIINHLKNVNITGLKNLNLIDFQMEAKTVQLKLNLDIIITGDVVIEYKKESKHFPGEFTTIGKATVDTTYPYEMKNDESGVEHFLVGREETLVKVDELPKVKLSDKLMKEVLDDPSIKESRDKYLTNSASILKESLEKLIKEQVVPEIISNVREVAKILPTSTFFSD